MGIKRRDFLLSGAAAVASAAVTATGARAQGSGPKIGSDRQRVNNISRLKSSFSRKRTPLNKVRKPYDRLIRVSKEAALLESCSSLLHWDQQTFMPESGNFHRAEQMALIARLAHERFTSPELGECLELCEESSLSADQRSPEAVNVREIRRQYDKKTRLPDRLVEELARTSALAHPAWVEAKENSTFDTFRPWLEKLVELKREQAAAAGFEDSPYDALLDDYEPGEKEEHLKPLFSQLRRGLTELAEKINGSPRKPDTFILERNYPVQRQMVFGEMAAGMLGFDFSRGRLDEVVHPFCTGIGPGDTRITTRYDMRNFSKAFFGILHEAGHGLYEQGLDPEHYGTPMGESISLGIHESQSRLWENLVGRSRPFWEHFFPKVQNVFHEALRGVTLDRFLLAVNAVRPSFIRVEADEVTYNLHIIHRFEIERSLICAELEAKDVPGAWNEKFRQLLGLEVPDDARGCLQDVHWSWGFFGYFPTYCLGNLYAAQFFARAKRDIPELEQELACGRFSLLLGWLRENIHSQGMRYSAGDLVEKVTGETLSSQPLIAYLGEKYTRLYDL